MKVLAIGARGLLGGEFVRLIERSAGAIDLTTVGRPEIDLAEPNLLIDRLRDVDFDVLVNFAAFHKTDEVETNATAAIAVNAHAVHELARLSAEKSAVLYHISTDYVFGGDSTRRTPYREDDTIAPINVYGASKAMGESLARFEHDCVVIARVASLFGEAQTPSQGGDFIETMLRMAGANKPLSVVDDQTMSPTATTDAAAALIALLEQGVTDGVYHVVNSGAASWYEFAREIFRQAMVPADLCPIASAEYPLVATRPRYSVLDNAKVAAISGQMPDWRDALARRLSATGRLGESRA